MNSCALYVTFQPNIADLKESIATVRDQVGLIIIVDNSDKKDAQDQVKSLAEEKVLILSQMKNIGIASALNKGCREAAERGFDWILTLDQDSHPQKGMVKAYDEFISKHPDEKIGAVGPLFTFSSRDRVEVSDSYEKVADLITSGCYVSVEAFKNVGGFRDDLFIDSVDTEFSWHLRKNGYSLFRLNNVLLEHNLGHNAYHIKFFGKRIMTITNHNYLRCYYIARNSRVVGRDYSKVFPQDGVPYLRKAYKKAFMVLFFEKDKIRKLKAVRAGMADAKKEKLGVCKRTF